MSVSPCRLDLAASLTLLAAALLATSPGCRAEEAPLRVFAAQSLRDAFEEAAGRFEAQFPGTRVELHFGGTGTLRAQIDAGAPADIFAALDVQHLQAMEAEGRFAADPQPFAGNRLVLIVPQSSPTVPTSPADLADPAFTRIALGDPERMAAGEYTRRVLERLGLTDLVGEKGILCQDVRQSLLYVARGEVDAGFVFATDAAVEAERVRVVWTAPEEQTGPIVLRAARLTGAEQPEWADRFIAFVGSAEGQSILRRHGFFPLPGP